MGRYLCYTEEKTSILTWNRFLILQIIVLLIVVTYLFSITLVSLIQNHNDHKTIILKTSQMVILIMNIKKHRRRYVACTITKLNLYQNYFSRFLVATKSYLLMNVTMPRSFLNGLLKK